MKSTEADFVALAALILEGRTRPVARAKLVGPLAQLLCAASRGQGSLSLAECQVPEDAPKELFAVRGARVLLPRNAALFDEVTLRLKEQFARPRAAMGTKEIRAALASILPRSTERSAEGRVLFDNQGQRWAVATQLDARLGVMTGGPGTGKTTVAATLLAVRKRLEPELAVEDVLLSAPTGKAACRLGEAMRSAALRLPLEPEEREFLLALAPKTLHRALVWSPLPEERGGPFGRNSRRPLQERLVLVDEASMVDLELFTCLLRALSPDASLWILGDADQLESVETGGVLTELLRLGSERVPEARHAELCARLDEPEALVVSSAGEAETTALPGMVSRLEHSYRARSAPHILELARLVRPFGDGTAERFLEACRRAQGEVMLFREPGAFMAHCVSRWRALADSRPSELSELSEWLRRFQLLCVDNARVERANRRGLGLLSDSRSVQVQRELPHGCPLIVRQNRPALGLSNGDLGVALGSGPGRPAEVVVFPGLEQPIAVAELPQHEPAFGLTVHKSQGSEWDEVAIDLSTQSELLDRNLLYTALTRASRRLSLLIPNQASLAAVLERAPAP